MQIDEVFIPGEIMRRLIADFEATKDQPDLSDDVWLKLSPETTFDMYGDEVYVATDIA